MSRVQATAAAGTSRRAIGPAGTGARIVLGLVAIALAFLTGEFALYSVPLGLVVAPAVLSVGQWLRARRVPARFQATGPVGYAVSFLVAIPFFVIAETRAATFLFYGASLLVAAARGYAGCEVLALSNWLLRRDDQVGCVILSPIDAAEAQAAKAG